MSDMKRRVTDKERRRIQREMATGRPVRAKRKDGKLPYQWAAEIEEEKRRRRKQRAFKSFKKQPPGGPKGPAQTAGPVSGPWDTGHCAMACGTVVVRLSPNA